MTEYNFWTFSTTLCVFVLNGRCLSLMLIFIFFLILSKYKQSNPNEKQQQTEKTEILTRLVVNLIVF